MGTDRIAIESICTICRKRYMQIRHPMLGVPGPCPECKAEPSPWTKAVSVCNCDRQRFIEYKLTPQQVDKLIGHKPGETYVIHMPMHPDQDTPHIFCTDGSRAEITYRQSFSI